VPKEVNGAVSDAARIPTEVLLAKEVQWEVLIDAYLTSAAKVGDRYAGVAYLDRSRVIVNGSTVATPLVRAVDERQGFVLLQTLCGRDHYVIATWQSPGAVQ
jgi:aminoglycoside/choline kinase family phosphotransferase